MLTRARRHVDEGQAPVVAAGGDYRTKAGHEYGDYGS